MKKSIIIILIIIPFLITSCDSENSIPEVIESDFYGTWILTSAKSERLIDYNNDGQSSNDLIDDLNCFTLELTFNNDGTFKEVRIDKPNTIDSGISCIQINLIGTWTLNSNKIVMTYNNSDFETQENSFEFINDSRFIIKRLFNDLNGDFLVDLRLAHT